MTEAPAQLVPGLVSQLVPGLVSAVICNYNGEAHLDDCLRSLKEQAYPSLEIIVSDNGSTDRSEAICAEYGVKFLPSGGNNGLAWAYNAGVRRSRGEFAFVANNDMEFAPECIERLVAAMHRHGQRCFAADPLQYDWARERIIHYRTVLRPLARPRELVNAVFAVFPLLAQAQVPADGEEICFMASAGAMLVRRSLFDELGGFDSTFFMDWEDVDISWRANRRGWKCVFVPSARLRHKWRATNAAISRKSIATARRLAASQQYNMIRFALKNFDAANALAVAAIRCAANLVYPFRGQGFRSLAGLQAIARVVRTFPSILRERAVVRRTASVSNRDLFRQLRVDCERFADSWPAEIARPRTAGAG